MQDGDELRRIILLWSGAVGHFEHQLTRAMSGTSMSYIGADSPDLLQLYSSHANRLPSVLLEASSDESPNVKAVFTPDRLSPPPHLSTGSLIIRKGRHTYTAWCVDEVHFIADPVVFACLGLCMIGTLLRTEQTEVVIDLTHPETEVTKLVIRPASADLPQDASTIDGWPMGYVSRPLAFTYYPRQLKYFPLQGLSGAEAPVLQLFGSGDEAGSALSDERDTLIGIGSDMAAFSFAELLLNVSQQWQEHREYALECSAGFGGVGFDSAEVRLWLPGGET